MSINLLKAKFVCLFCGLLVAISLFGQEKYTLSGYVRDSTSGENLIGANIMVKGLQKGTTTNGYGFYSLTIPSGQHTIVYSYLGFKTKTFTVSLSGDVRKNVQLIPQAYEAEEVVVKGERKDENVESTDMGKFKIPMEKIEKLPAIFGEVDVLKTIQLMPGVQSASEGNSGLYVRGGGPGQNLVLLDEAKVYNTGHLFGFFSVFNSDAINNTTLIKGGIPANYGGRLGAVLDISMKEGNDQRYHADGGIGTIASRLNVEGPIQKGKSSFLISGRRTYIDVLMKPFIENTDFEGTGYYFYDLNTKLNYKFSDKDRLYLSGYFGRDVFNYVSPDREFNVEIPWGNTTATLRWNHLFSDKLFMNVSAIYNDYNFELKATQDNFTFKMLSGIRDFNLKTDFNYYPDVLHNIKFGLNYTYHTFTPSSASAETEEGEVLPEQINQKYAHEAAVYALDEFEVTDWLKVNAGLRVPFFQQIGPYTRYEEDFLGRKVDSTIYKSGEPIATYFGLEPRVSSRFKLGAKSSLKASITRTNQFVHLVSNSGTTLPTDIWVPSSSLVKPQRGTQYAMGFYRNFAAIGGKTKEGRGNMYETSVEVFYRDMKNQIEFRQGYVPEVNEEVEKDFVFGEGWAYGAEFLIRKQYGKFNGWIGYTFSRTMRQFDELNNGEPYPAKYDRTHDVSVVAMYEWKRWTFASTFVFATGNAITLPISRYVIGGVLTGDYGKRNNYRMKPYHRLDLSATLNSKEDAKFKSSWTFSIYNVYNRKNPYFIYFDNEGNFLQGTLDVQAKQVSLFPILPSITWNFSI